MMVFFFCERLSPASDENAWCFFSCVGTQARPLAKMPVLFLCVGGHKGLPIGENAWFEVFPAARKATRIHHVYY